MIYKIAKKTVLIVGLTLTFFTTNAQIFTSTNGTTNVNAASVGEPNVSNGQVRLKNAPNVNGNINAVKNNLTEAGISSGIINNARVLGNGGFASQIADMWAVKQTAIKLNQRPATAPTSGAIVINSQAGLESNRGILKDNSTRTFVFRGYIAVGYPILIGSNKTVWIDGTLDYNGVDVVPEGGAAFTPRPLKNDGVLSIRHEGSFRRTFKPLSEANQAFNRDLMNNVIKQNRKGNVTIKGTKRGKIIVRNSNVMDDKQLIPKANGIAALSNNNLTIDGVTIEGALNAIYVSGSFNVNIRNCFTDKTVYRAIHLHATQSNRAQGFGVIKNNLLAFSKFDGIDIDSFSAGFLIEENFVIGARDRLLIWTEIDAADNTIDNNVGIILDAASGGGARQAQSGGYQENGTEAQRIGNPGFNGTRNNTWTNNHSFYAEKRYDGFEMRKDRYIQFNTTTFTNNYVWTLNQNLHKHNPKANTLNDIYYLVGTGATEPTTSGIPFNKEIAIRKSVGDKQYLQVNPGTGAELASTGGTSAPTQSWQTWERFVVTEHPQGGVALYSLANSKYLQVNGSNKSTPVRANGPASTSNPLSWERFEWKDKGGNDFSLRSIHYGNNNAWLQCTPTNNAKVHVNGGAALSWETFTYQVVSETARKSLGTKPSLNMEVYPNPVSVGDNININTVLPKQGPVQVNIFSITGAMVYESYADNVAVGATLTVNTSNLLPGIYMVKVISEGITETLKISLN